MNAPELFDQRDEDGVVVLLNEHPSAEQAEGDAVVAGVHELHARQEGAFFAWMDRRFDSLLGQAVEHQHEHHHGRGATPVQELAATLRAQSACGARTTSGKPQP